MTEKNQKNDKDDKDDKKPKEGIRRPETGKVFRNRGVEVKK